MKFLYIYVREDLFGEFIMTKDQVYAALHMYKKQIYNIAKELKIDFTIDDSIKLIVYKIVKQTKSSITLQNVLKYYTLYVDMSTRTVHKIWKDGDE